MRYNSFYFRIIAILIAASILFGSCKSMTIIDTEPSGAHLYLNERYVGETPYRHMDDDIIFTKNFVRLELDGFKPLITSFSKDEDVEMGAALAGILLFPLLWIFKYDESHIYTLTPANEENLSPIPADVSYPVTEPSSQSVYDKADQLRELKKLLDEGIITKDEFEIEKKKILNKSE